MAEHAEQLTQRFDELRPDLVRVAYGTLGSIADAEDVVQEAWVRAQRADLTEVRDLRAWLTTIVARLAIDAYRATRARREAYIGPWLPEPVVEELDPADRVTLDETIGMALMLVLERLSPAERAAFVLHDVFGVPFEEVATVVGRTPAAVRQLASRARRRVEDERPRFTPSADEQLAVVGAFAAACQAGDLDGLLRVLDPDVVWRSDGGGLVQSARKPIHGARRVAKAMIALARGVVSARPALVNGAPGIVVTGTDGVLTVEAFTIVDGRITALDFVRNPEKLRHVEA